MKEICLDCNQLMQKWGIGEASLIHYFGEGLRAYHPPTDRWIIGTSGSFQSTYSTREEQEQEQEDVSRAIEKAKEKMSEAESSSSQGFDFLEAFQEERSLHLKYDPLTREKVAAILPELVFPVEDVEAFEREYEHEITCNQNPSYKQQLAKRHTLSEKNRALLSFAKEKRRKTPDKSIPTIVKLFIKSAPNIMYDANGDIRRGYSQENLEKVLRDLLKSAK